MKSNSGIFSLLLLPPIHYRLFEFFLDFGMKVWAPKVKKNLH